MDKIFQLTNTDSLSYWSKQEELDLHFNAPKISVNANSWLGEIWIQDLLNTKIEW
jgi:hypothetical protein